MKFVDGVVRSQAKNVPHYLECCRAQSTFVYVVARLGELALLLGLQLPAGNERSRAAGALAAAVNTREAGATGSADQNLPLQAWTAGEKSNLTLRQQVWQ